MRSNNSEFRIPNSELKPSVPRHPVRDKIKNVVEDEHEFIVKVEPVHRLKSGEREGRGAEKAPDEPQ